MINNQERTSIITILGKHYSSTISLHLKEKNIKNAIGEDYTRQSIRTFVNGMRENEQVELAIMELVNKTIKAKKSLQQKRQRLLKV